MEYIFCIFIGQLPHGHLHYQIQYSQLQSVYSFALILSFRAIFLQRYNVTRNSTFMIIKNFIHTILFNRCIQRLSPFKEYVGGKELKMSCQSCCLTFKCRLKAPSQGSTAPRNFFPQCQMQSACRSILTPAPLSKVLSQHAKARCCLHRKLWKPSAYHQAAFLYTESSLKVFRVSLFLLTVFPPTPLSSEAVYVRKPRQKSLPVTVQKY